MKRSLEERRNMEVSPRCSDGNVVNDVQVIEGDGGRFGGRRHVGNGMEIRISGRTIPSMST